MGLRLSTLFGLNIILKELQKCEHKLVKKFIRAEQSNPCDMTQNNELRH